MDFSSLIGWVAGLGLMVYGIMSGGRFSDFIDPPSIAITVGGTFASLLIAFPFSYFKQMGSHFKIILSNSGDKYNPFIYISKISELAQEARRKGLLALEDKANESEDKFLRDSIMLIVDAIEADKVKQLLENELDALEERHDKARVFYDRGAGFAPAFGMIGTLVGLVNMLGNMDSNPDGLGKGMATALITTLYGSMLANLLFTPMSNKLKVRHDEEMICKRIIVEGIISIQAGENPKHIEEKLFYYVPETVREKYGNSGEASAESEKPKKKGKKNAEAA